MPLTDLAVRKAAPKAAPYKLTDGAGLYLLVRPDGARYWRLDYRWAGKRGTLALGVYPLVSLLEAREKRDRAKKQLAAGIDPSAQRKLDKVTIATAAKNTFRLVADEWVAKLEREGRAEATLSKTKWLIDLVFPVIGERPVSEIGAPELLNALRRVEARGRFETARRLRSTCGQVFRYAIATGRAERDPSADLRGALTSPKVKHRAAITEPAAIGAILRAIEGYDGHPVVRAALRLVPLVFVRPGELRYAEWSEIDFDAREWRIPAAKMKMRQPHRVPLATQAIAILKELKDITGNGRYLFPSIRSVMRPISENTLNAALRRMGYTNDEVTAHGFRATAAVRLNEMNRFNPDAIERQLAHQEPNAVRRAYNRRVLLALSYLRRKALDPDEGELSLPEDDFRVLLSGAEAEDESRRPRSWWF